MSNAREVRQSLNKICNLVLNGELGAKEANCIMYGANIILQSIRVDEVQTKIEQLEKTINEIQELKER